MIKIIYIPVDVYIQFFFFFLHPQLQHMKVSGLGVESELQPQPQQYQIPATSVTYTAGCDKARSLSHWAKPVIEPASSQTTCQVLNPLCHSKDSNSIQPFNEIHRMSLLNMLSCWVLLIDKLSGVFKSSFFSISLLLNISLL